MTIDNFIVISRAQRKNGAVSYGIAHVNSSTGEFKVFDVLYADESHRQRDHVPDHLSPDDDSLHLHALITSLNPSPTKIVIPDRLRDDIDLMTVLDMNASLASLGDGCRGDAFSGERMICEHYGVPSLDGFVQLSRPEVAAIGSAIAYRGTHAGQLPRPQRG